MDKKPEADKGGVPFGSNAVRLSPREWVVAAVIIALALVLLPFTWTTLEPLDAGPDYRVPYSLGSDYWLYRRYVRRLCTQDRTLVVGDSVVWGHYVASDQTLSHYLADTGHQPRFANAGVDGSHPAALAGLIDHYGGAISGRSVLAHCNLLWLSSQKHDLQTRKEFSFNHPQLVPQFSPRIACYNETFATRLGIVVGRALPFFGWADHLRIAYFGSTDLNTWATEHPYGNPLRQITLELPTANETPTPKPVARPWTDKGIRRFAASWVALDTSFQWWSFRRTVRILRQRGNRVFVVLGPFNEHMLKPDSLAAYQKLKGQVAAWLQGQGIPHFVPDPLPSELYADASHPLAEGYKLLAQQLYEHQAFVRFDGRRSNTTSEALK